MDTRKTTTYFHILACIATALLWGISFWNGTVKALLLAVWTGQLGDEGEALKRNYTGIVALDYPINLLVAFFYYGTCGHDDGYQLFLLDAYATLQSAFVWLYVESFRESAKKSKWVTRPVIFGLLWQAFGAAIALPLYYAAHLRAIFQPAKGQKDVQFNHLDVPHGKTIKGIHLAQAKALPFAFVLGAVIPTLIGMSPTWTTHNSRSPSFHQNILFAWQADPVWVSLLLITLSTVAARTGSERERSDDRKRVRRWINVSYLLAFFWSLSGHVYVFHRVLTTSDTKAVNFVRMYVPFLSSGPSDAGANVLVWGPWLFLQYDLIIISLSSLSWAYILLISVGPKPAQWQRVSLGLGMLAASVTFGPGAIVSLALITREEMLEGAELEVEVANKDVSTMTLGKRVGVKGRN